jgi:uridine phosphorylase
MTDHLRPTAAIAAEAVLPGDPGRALALAQHLLEAPRMANHARGLWGYTAVTPEGRPLTVQSTGIGGPSVSIVLHELQSLGVRRAIRLGTCRAVAPSVAAGDLVAVVEALTPDGAKAMPAAALTQSMLANAGVRGVTLAGSDRYYDPAPEAARRGWAAAGADVVDLGTAALLETGAQVGVEVASALVVARDDSRTLSDEEVEARSLELGRLASAALAG